MVVVVVWVPSHMLRGTAKKTFLKTGKIAPSLLSLGGLESHLGENLLQVIKLPLVMKI